MLTDRPSKCGTPYLCFSGGTFRDAILDDICKFFADFCACLCEGSRPTLFLRTCVLTTSCSPWSPPLVRHRLLLPLVSHHSISSPSIDPSTRPQLPCSHFLLPAEPPSIDAPDSCSHPMLPSHAPTGLPPLQSVTVDRPDSCSQLSHRRRTHLLLPLRHIYCATRDPPTPAKRIEPATSHTPLRCAHRSAIRPLDSTYALRTAIPLHSPPAPLPAPNTPTTHVSTANTPVHNPANTTTSSRTRTPRHAPPCP